jgi:hypothetical protein
MWPPLMSSMPPMYWSVATMPRILAQQLQLLVAVAFPQGLL